MCTMSHCIIGDDTAYTYICFLSHIYIYFYDILIVVNDNLVYYISIYFYSDFCLIYQLSPLFGTSSYGKLLPRSVTYNGSDSVYDEF